MSNRHYDAQYEPRPGEQAYADDQRYHQFLERLARIGGLGNAARAERAAVAVLCNLERRISGPEAHGLNEELPWALRDLLRRCELHPRQRPEKVGSEELVQRIAEELAVEAFEAERVARTVLSVTRSMLSDREASDVLAQLPPDVAALWTPPA